MKLPIVLVLALGGSALAFGAVYRWAYIPLLLFCTTVGILGLSRDFRTTTREARAITGWIGLLSAAIAITLIPIPFEWLAQISPGASRFLRNYNLVHAFATPQNPPPWHPLSIAPPKTWLALCFVLGLAIYSLGLVRLASRRLVRKTTSGIVAFGALLAIVGIVQHANFDGRLYGFFVPRSGVLPFTPDGGPFGPFINRNHFAGWMIMAIPVALGHLSGLLYESMRDVRADWRSRLIWFSSPAASEALLVSAAIIVMSIALLMTLSRSGAVCLALIVMVMSVIMIRRQRSWRRLAVTGFLFALFLIGPQFIDLDSVADRFSRIEHDAVGRIRPWQDATAVIRDFPWTGSGLNTYGTAMLSYQTFRLGEAHYGEAHNDYLQLMAEGGVLLAVPAIGLFYQVVKRAKLQLQLDQHNVASHWRRIGAAAGVAAMLLQEIGEFSLQIPANAALFVTLVVFALYDSTPHPTRYQ